MESQLIVNTRGLKLQLPWVAPGNEQAEKEAQEEKKAKLETMTLDKKRQIDTNAVSSLTIGRGWKDRMILTS